MKNIVISTQYKSEDFVSRDKLASTVGSGDADVFATPMMVALMENAAMKCLLQFLEEGESSVGTEISASHISATPLGMKVYAVATLTGFEGKRVEFNVEAFDECGKIGEAKHTRFIINLEKFSNKTNAKIKA